MTYTKPDKFPCPFCEIINGRIPVATLFKNELAIAYMAVNRRSKGAVLISPIRHVEEISQMTEKEASCVMSLIQKVAKSIIFVYNPDGIHTFCNAGIRAGQSVCHTHFQIQTRFEKEDYSFSPAVDLPWIPVEELKRTTIKLKQYQHRKKEQMPSFKVPEDSFLPLNMDLIKETIIKETNYFLVIPPPQNRVKGAVVILPKEKIQNIYMLSKSASLELILLVRKLCIAIEAAYDPIGLSVWCEVGEVADQVYDHFLFEITPYHEGVNYKYQPRKTLSNTPLKERIQTTKDISKFL